MISHLAGWTAQMAEWPRDTHEKECSLIERCYRCSPAFAERVRRMRDDAHLDVTLVDSFGELMTLGSAIVPLIRPNTEHAQRRY